MQSLHENNYFRGDFAFMLLYFKNNKRSLLLTLMDPNRIYSFTNSDAI